MRPPPGRSSRVRAHWSRIRLRRRASSEMVPARPRPRTRSRVACTSSRTPGFDSSAPSSSTVSRCVSRPTRCSSGADRGEQRLVGARGDPQLQRGGEHRRGEVVAEHLQHGPGPPRARRAALGAAAASSAPRTSVRCSTAATTRAFLVGKWWSCAPRLTPARSLTSVVDVPLKPRSTSSSTVASISRARIAGCAPPGGTRVAAPWRHLARMAAQTTNSQDLTCPCPDESVRAGPANGIRESREQRRPRPRSAADRRRPRSPRTIRPGHVEERAASTHVNVSTPRGRCSHSRTGRSADR